MDLGVVDGVVGSIGTPPGYGGEGISEFTVYLPEGTNTAYISIPLVVALSENKGYGEYITANEVTDWGAFDTDGRAEVGDAPRVFDDTYYSAPGSVDGSGAITCPPPVNPSSGITHWGNQDGMLLKDHQCVLLVITDGGHNDSDGQLNGVIVDPSAPAGGASAPDGGERLVPIALLMVVQVLIT